MNEWIIHQWNKGGNKWMIKWIYQWMNKQPMNELIDQVTDLPKGFEPEQKTRNGRANPTPTNQAINQSINQVTDLPNAFEPEQKNRNGRANPTPTNQPINQSINPPSLKVQGVFSSPHSAPQNGRRHLSLRRLSSALRVRWVQNTSCTSNLNARAKSTLNTSISGQWVN